MYDFVVVVRPFKPEYIYLLKLNKHVNTNGNVSVVFEKAHKKIE